MRVPYAQAKRILAKSRRQVAAREREARAQGYRSASTYARANRARPGTGGGLRVAGLTAGDVKRFGSRKTLLGAAAPGFYKLGRPVVTAPLNVARATIEDPGEVIPATARGLRDMVVGLPSAVIKTATDPKGAAKDLVGDYARRYGPLVEGDEAEFRRRLRKEGVASELLDIGGVTAVGGRAAGAVGRATGRGPTVRKRPALRRSGGKATPQSTSRNANVAYLQHKLDRTRGRVSARRQATAEKGGRVPALDVSLGPGEVAPLRRGNVIGDRTVGRRKSRGVQAMKAEQSREVHRGASRAVAQLDRNERRGFKYAMQLGIRDPQAAVAALTEHRKRIVREREAQGTEIPKTLRGTNDELPVIDRLLADPGKVFTPRLAQVAEGERLRGNRVAQSDPGLATEQALLRRYAQQAEHLGVKRQRQPAVAHELEAANKQFWTALHRAQALKKKGKDPARELAKAKAAEHRFNALKAGAPESTAAFVKRVRAAAEKQGLSRPAYFASQKRPEAKYGSYALGGAKAVAEDKRYTGALFRTGREDTRPQVHADALAQNIKRKHNWNTVADNFESNAFAWGKNKTIGQLRDELDRRGIDPGSVAFWNPGKYRDARKGTEGQREEAFGDDVAPPGLDKAVDEAATDWHGLSTKGEDFANTSGWSVIPKSVYDEIHADTRPSGKVARSWDVVKGKQSRILLGTNPPWLAFQAASNTLLTGLAKTGPFDAAKSVAWWRRLDPAQREAAMTYVGVGAHHVDVQQTKLGASANGRLTNGYRAFKQTPALQRLGKMNPLDAMFRADNAQNNFFRKAVLYSQVKREAYRRIGLNVGGAAAMQARTHGLFTLGPEAQMKAVLRDRPALERHAAHVNNMLGDYLTYTAKERRILGRSVMFYGFLRFSLNFTFHTMPTKHPVMSALIGNLGRLQTEEVRRLLGGDELPFALGKLYYTKDGKLKEVGLARLNPATNAVMEMVGNPRPLGKLIGSLPPIVNTALDLAFEKTGFTGKPLMVEGEHRKGAEERQATGIGIGDANAARVAANRMLRLAMPYRAWEGVEYKGVPHGDDSFPFAPRPTGYKDPKVTGDIAKSRRRQAAKGTGGLLLEEFAPFLPKDTRDPEIAARIRERRAGTKAKPKTVRGEFESFREESRANRVRDEFEKYRTGR